MNLTMMRTITVDTGDKLREFIEGLIEAGSYKTKSEVVRQGLRLLQEQQAQSKVETLRQLIDEGDNSGNLINWDLEQFLEQMNNEK